jgi:hypothetical protein
MTTFLNMEMAIVRQLGSQEALGGLMLDLSLLHLEVC